MPIIDDDSCEINTAMFIAPTELSIQSDRKFQELNTIPVVQDETVNTSSETIANNLGEMRVDMTNIISLLTVLNENSKNLQTKVSNLENEIRILRNNPTSTSNSNQNNTLSTSLPHSQTTNVP